MHSRRTEELSTDTAPDSSPSFHSFYQCNPIDSSPITTDRKRKCLFKSHFSQQYLNVSLRKSIDYATISPKRQPLRY
jgi:hypothetical protein